MTSLATTGCMAQQETPRKENAGKLKITMSVSLVLPILVLPMMHDIHNQQLLLRAVTSWNSWEKGDRRNRWGRAVFEGGSDVRDEVQKNKRIFRKIGFPFSKWKTGTFLLIRAHGMDCAAKGRELWANRGQCGKSKCGINWDISLTFLVSHFLQAMIHWKLSTSPCYFS